ncbi:MAG: HD domain-containing protein [Oscillospiraceae bacterium]|jgi:response regulator RpfG family c-di-GMP phosphodiesterase|nr:HD domain-containing protein [Oscillospiraceae bacterium]
MKKQITQVSIEDLEQNPTICPDIEDVFALLPSPLQAHCLRVGKSMPLIVKYAPYLVDTYRFKDMDELQCAAYSGGIHHDIGKAITSAQFSSSVFERVSHPILGRAYFDLNIANFDYDEAKNMILRDIISYHHERQDGKGIPYGKCGTEIPLASAICSIADMLDHLLLAPGRGRKRLDFDRALIYIQSQLGVMFSGTAVSVFSEAKDELLANYETYTREKAV